MLKLQKLGYRRFEKDLQLPIKNSTLNVYSKLLKVLVYISSLLENVVNIVNYIYIFNNLMYLMSLTIT